MDKDAPHTPHRLDSTVKKFRRIFYGLVVVLVLSSGLVLLLPNGMAQFWMRFFGFIPVACIGSGLVFGSLWLYSYCRRGYELMDIVIPGDEIEPDKRYFGTGARIWSVAGIILAVAAMILGLGFTGIMIWIVTTS